MLKQEAMKIALNMVKARSYSEADTIFKLLLTAFPGNHGISVTYSNFLFGIGRHDDAEDLLSRIPEESRDFYSYYLMSRTSLAKGRLSIAQDQMNAAIRHRIPKNLPLLVDVGEHLSELGVDKLSRICFSEALRDKAVPANFLKRIGRAAMSHGYLPEAEAAYRRWIALEPGNGFAHCKLGDLYWANGAREPAYKAYRDALSQSRDFREVLRRT